MHICSLSPLNISWFGFYGTRHHGWMGGWMEEGCGKELPTTSVACKTCAIWPSVECFNYSLTHSKLQVPLGPFVVFFRTGFSLGSGTSMMRKVNIMKCAISQKNCFVWQQIKHNFVLSSLCSPSCSSFSSFQRKLHYYNSIWFAGLLYVAQDCSCLQPLARFFSL